ncbi:MAG: hypothetical protein SFU99_17350 [Saprospiraceae bacterium]|nr:hypothetical protein [Saprospiraceae bacterium]
MANQNNILPYFIYIAILLGIVGLIVLYVFEFEYFNRTFQVGTMTFWSMLIGIAFGLLVARRFLKSANDLIDRVRVVLLCTVGIAIFMPLFASLSNRLWSFHPTTPVAVEFVESEAYIGSALGLMRGEKITPTGHRTFVYRDTKLLKIQTKEALFPEAQRGDTVQLPVKKGLWGFEFVSK